MQTELKSHPRGIVSRAIYWGGVGAAVGGTCAALYGLLFGEIEIAVTGEAWRLLAVVGYFALCGLIAGAMVGALAGTVNGHLNGRGGKAPPPKG